MKYLIFFSILLFWTGCQNSTPIKSKDNRVVKPVKKANGDYSEIIRIEDSILDEHADTNAMAKMTFENPIFDFGIVNEGDIVKHTFHYKNTGRKPLMLKVAHSTCGCTVPHYNAETPLPPGERDSIVVTFNTTNKPNRQSKPITVVANSYPNKVKLYLRGYVNEKK